MKSKFIIFIVMLFAVFFSVNAKGEGIMAFFIKSKSFSDGAVIPEKFTCEGRDLSPELIWGELPKGTKGLCLIVEDPDAPMGTFTHWIVYDIPADTLRFDEGMKLKGAIKTGITDFGRPGYGGPCPPKGHGTHRYIFILRALDIEELGLKNGASKADVEKAMKGHIVGEARFTGKFKRD